MPVTRIEFGRIKGRGDGQRENYDETVLGVFRFQHNKNESTVEMQTSLSGSPLRSDGVDETGDANRTLVWVARRTTGRGGETTIGSIRTHSLRGWNSRRAANAERVVGQSSIGYLKRQSSIKTVGGISHGSVPCPSDDLDNYPVNGPP